MRPHLIATDLDGTFLGSHATPHLANIDAAQAAVDAGIHFVVATGRPRRWLQPIAELLQLNPLVIANNGAAVGRLQEEADTTLSHLDTEVVLAFVEQLPPELDVAVAVEYEWKWGREPDYPLVRLDEAEHVGPLAELLAVEPALKILVRTPHATTEQFAPLALEAAGDDMECTFSWSDEFGTVELTAAGVTKGAALAGILDSHQVDPADVAAFGDMPNDLSMLRLVGQPFIMANAHPILVEEGFPQIGHHADGAVGAKIRDWL